MVSCCAENATKERDKEIEGIDEFEQESGEEALRFFLRRQCLWLTATN